VSYVWEYLDWAYMRQDTFLHDLMKLVHAVKGIREKNYRGLEVYLGLLLRIFDIAEETGCCPSCTRTTCSQCTRSGCMGTRPGGGHMQRKPTSWTNLRSSADTSGDGIT
jgi:hypothetical protein